MGSSFAFCAEVMPVIDFCVSRMSALECLAQERIWFDKPRYDEAERRFYERMNGPTLPPQVRMCILQLMQKRILYLCICSLFVHKINLR